MGVQHTTVLQALQKSLIKVTVVACQDRQTIKRFQRFFGASVETVENGGFQKWWRRCSRTRRNRKSVN